VGEDLDLPDELFGFGSWLLWILATRATVVVDRAFAAGPARPSRHYGMVDGHPVPTPSLVAWMLAAAESGLALEELAGRHARLDERQKVLRTIVSRAVGGEPRLFKDAWLRQLGRVCGLGDAELDLLARSRDDEGYPVDPQALRTAIARTLRAHPAASPPPTGEDLALLEAGVALSGGSPAPGTRVGGVAAATRTLPRDIGSFTGREQEVLLLAGVAAGNSRSAQVVGIHAIGGMAGIGKTTFAVHVAHRLAPRFPDGQIFLPLHGHTPGHQPVDPGDALASLLLTAGVPVAQIPPGLEARMALWRDRVAGKQLLLLLDDAANSDQVRPLLPGSAECLVLVTSRRHLTALEDATAISLDTLSVGEAAELLVRLAARPGLEPGDGSVAEITRLCGYLPLAIGMLARQMHHHPAWTTAELAAELAATRDRLELMRAENLSVAAAFDLSYQDLAPGPQRLFRRLGLHLGADIDSYAAAALDGTELITARRHLEALYDQHLIAEPARGRYRFHDLIREHARAMAATDEPSDQEAATGRILDYYQHTAATAEGLLARHARTRPDPAAPASPPTAVPDLPDRNRALAWIRAERANLFACLDYAARTGQHARVVACTASVAALLRQDGPWTDAIARHATAAQAARLAGDRHGEARALLDLGGARELVCDYPGATQVLAEALGISRQLGDRQGEANALLDLAPVRLQIGDYPAAASALEEALDIHRDFGDRLGQANALLDLGVVRRLTGERHAATEALRESLRLYRDLGDRRNQGNALNDLGDIWLDAGEYPDAIRAFQEALDIFRDLGNRKGQANSLTCLALVRVETGDYAGAARLLEEALDIYRDIGEPLGQGNTLHNLGDVRRKSGDYPGAAQLQEEALGIYRGIGHPLGIANALDSLGAARRDMGDFPGAAQMLAEALDIYREIGNRPGEADALNEAGTLNRVLGQLDQAAACHRQALDLAREIDSPEDEALALAGLGRCAVAAGCIADAKIALRQALEIFRRTGRAEAADVAAELDALNAQKLSRYGVVPG
jgi:tetratricopeptide (TPR) repeat protein